MMKYMKENMDLIGIQAKKSEGLEIHIDVV
jgi:hypothetical protein